VAPQQTSENDFTSWVEAGQHRRAAEWLVRRYADEVMGLCTAMVRDRVAAEDLVQDVFSRAFMGLAGFRAEASSRTWLLKIARNRCIDHLRAKNREPWGVGDPELGFDADAFPDDEPMPPDLLDRREDVEAALDSLVEGDRALIVLRFRNGLDYSELAMAFGLKPGTVRMRVSRALARMRGALEQRAQAQPALQQRAALAEELAASAPGAPPAESAAPAAPRLSAARSEAMPRSARKKRGRSVLSRALGAVFGAQPAAPSPPLEHPLTAFFAATREALSGELRERLQAQVGQV
jgi:RNA polymerase sigma-70 factor (ECF subfamily)